MAGPNRQEGRIARLVTPLGADELVLTRFDGTEGISELFEYRIEALSSKENIDFDLIIGDHCTVSVQALDGTMRHFDGILTEAQWIGVRDDSYVYRLVLRPWLYLLSFRTDCYIFHNETLSDIIRAVFQRHASIAHYTLPALHGSRKIEYCVQYRESDMAFVCRLLEEYGVSYYFTHVAGKHTLVLCEETSGYQTIPGSSRPYISITNQNRRDTEHFFQWIPERRFTSGKVMRTDYDFKRPQADMKATADAPAGHALASLELFDYPGRYSDPQIDRDAIAKAVLHASRGQDGHIAAAGDCITCFPGALVKLEDHPNEAQNKEYLALRCVHSFRAESYRGGGGAAESGEFYHGDYEFFTTARRYVAPAVTERPRIHGPQTAVVVGGAEIDVDKYGRILVRFFWDRKKGQSMRCRLSQVWAGRKWGGMFIPRVGMEVIVEFIDGDPDRPIVVGTVYNEDNMPPYGLPGDKNIAGLKSKTVDGSGYNEFVMDDTPGKELIRMHAQYDRETVIENDERRTVHGKRNTRIDKTDTLDVGDKVLVKAGNEIELVTGMSKITMKKDGTINIEGVNITVKAVAGITVESTGTLTTKGIAVDHNASGTMIIKGAVVMIN